MQTHPAKPSRTRPEPAGLAPSPLNPSTSARHSASLVAYGSAARRGLVLLLLALSLISCDKIKQALGQKEDDTTLQLLTWLGILNPPADYYARLYYVDPLIVANTTDRARIWEATSSDVHSAKKKLVLVHGWHFEDRDFVGNYPSSDALKDRVLSQNWSAFLGTTDFATLVGTGAWDIYAFDYLTAVGVESNGTRLRSKLDRLFGPGDVVVLYGHSMGGLVSRFAVYHGDNPTHITRVITTGTPFHGSPWASPQFQDRTALGDLAAFFTDTQGGRDLAWDNYDHGLSGASNPTLDAVNAKTDRDARFFAYYGTLANPGTSGSGTLAPACLALPGTPAAWTPSDCIVPATSAQLANHTLGGTRDAGAYDHIQIKMEIATIRSQFVTDLNGAPGVAP